MPFRLMWSIIVLALIVVLGLLVIPTTHAQSEMQSLMIDDVEHSYYLHRPDDIATDAPLLIALHPSASNGRTMDLLTGLGDAAAERGFITVFPDSSDTVWNEGQAELDAEPDDVIPNDVGFIDVLISELTTQHEIDESRIYVAGDGTGGLMAMRLVCELPGRFAGIAVVGTLMWDYHAGQCAEALPLNMLIVHGSRDHIYFPETHPQVSLFVNDPRTIFGIDDTMSFWAERSACDLEALFSDDIPNLRSYSNCVDDVRLAYYGIEGEGHKWPRNGDYILNTSGVDASQMVIDFFAGDEDWAAAQQLTPHGTPRTFATYVPASYDAADAMPVVLTLHGRFGTGVGTASLTALNRFADENGFIAVYPQGLGQEGDFGWNFTKDVPGYRPDTQDDTLFLSDVIDDLAVDLNIDRSRIYVAGLSNGGFMVQRLACEDPEQYAGFASVAGAGFGGMNTVCPGGTPVNMLIMHGTNDTNIQFQGNIQTINGQQIYSTLPIQDIIGFWAFGNGCETDLTSEDLPPSDPATFVRVIMINGCPEGGDVVAYIVFGGGHNWPGTFGIPAQVAGNVNTDIHASQVIWDFFSQHSRP